MLWAIQERMKLALSVIDMIPDVHRTPALAALRKAVLDGRGGALRLSAEERELALYDGPAPLISPIGARMLKALYDAGRIKLKKPAQRSLPKLEAYIATEAAFRLEAAQILAEDEAKRDRLAVILKDPASARPDEITPYLIDKVATAELGYGAYGSVTIAGLACHRELIAPESVNTAQTRAEGRVLCWWVDANGTRQGDTA